MIERLLAGTWNRLVASGQTKQRNDQGLDLGLEIRDGQMGTWRYSLSQTKRTEHLAILGKTGHGKSFFLRHLATQDVRAGRGFVFFDLHGDTMPFLLRLIAAEEQRQGTDLSERLIVIEPGDPEYSIGLNVLEASAGQQSYVQLSEFAQILKSRWHLDSLGGRLRRAGLPSARPCSPAAYLPRMRLGMPNEAGQPGIANALGLNQV